jgi:hypothetical protein
MSILPLQRITGALRVWGYGDAYDAVDELIGIAEHTMALTLPRLFRAIVDEFGPEYLRELNEDNVRRILALNESRGFLGCLGSIANIGNRRTALWQGRISFLASSRRR